MSGAVRHLAHWLIAGLVFCAACGGPGGGPAVPAEGSDALQADPTLEPGPRGGPLFELGVREGYLEVQHDENWGTVAVHLYDSDLKQAVFDAPPVLNVWFADEGVRVEAGREDPRGSSEEGWHFEHDALLGVPEQARFRLHAFGRAYVVPLRHVHVTHGRVAGAHQALPVVPHEGPHGGTMLLLSDGRAVVELLHDPDLGTASVYCFDRLLSPVTFEGPVLLNVLMGDEPVQLIAGREDDEGRRDDGWHWEETALIGPPVGARLRFELGGRTYVPPFRPVCEEEEPHSHAER